VSGPGQIEGTSASFVDTTLTVQLEDQTAAVVDGVKGVPTTDLPATIASTLTDSEPDFKTVIVLSIMITVSGLLRFFQEFRSTKAAEKLKAMVRSTSTVIRSAGDGSGADGTLISAVGTVAGKREIPMAELVPGDIIQLSAGDMIPADVRLLHTKDLFVSQSALTGESMPVEKIDNLAAVVEKRADAVVTSTSDPLQIDTLYLPA
jgi:magnesium-transporting ATPase (P-type)